MLTDPRRHTKKWVKVQTTCEIQRTTLKMAETGRYNYACVTHWVRKLNNNWCTLWCDSTHDASLLARWTSVSIMTWGMKSWLGRSWEKHRVLSVVKLMTKYKEMISSWNAKELAAAANWLVEALVKRNLRLPKSALCLQWCQSITCRHVATVVCW